MRICKLDAKYPGVVQYLWGAVPDIRIGVLVKRQNNLWKEVNTAFFKAMALNGIVRRLVLLSPHQFIYINSIFYAPYLYFMLLTIMGAY